MQFQQKSLCSVLGAFPMTLKVIWKNKQIKKALKIIENNNTVSNTKMYYKTTIMKNEY